MIGQLVDGKYEIVQLIGEGGMGAVYEAKQKDGGDTCAVKVINDEEVAEDEVLVARFEREAKAAAKIKSPHIVEILDAGHDAETGHPYMVMERLTGENVLDLLERLGPLPTELAVRIGIQTCIGLAEAHKMGVVHRDIKPANLFLTKADDDELIIKLLDFGVAKFKMDQAAAADNESLTRTGSMLGSPMYMSPEQARGLKSIDHRADLWSLGIVMYQLITGRQPHEGIDGLGELIITICSEPPASVVKHAPWAPPALAQVVEGALKLVTGDRYESADAMREKLMACLAESAGDRPWRIDEAMLRELTDEERDARPVEAAPPAAATAAGLDATMAMDEGALEILAELDSADAKSADAKSADANQDPGEAKTLALEPEDVQASQDALAKEEARRKAKAKEEAATEPPPPVDSKAARHLERHREAQRAAISAARLDTPEEKNGKNPLMWVIVTGVALGLAGLAYTQMGSGDNVGLKPPGASSTPSAAPTPAPTPTPTPEDPAPEESPAPSGSAATSATSSASAASSAEQPASADGVKVKVPAGANVVIGGRLTKVVDGHVVLKGKPGKTVIITVINQANSRTVAVKITEDGAEPSAITFDKKKK